MARPKRGNFATGEAGLARYKEALKKYLAKTKKTTKPEVKKPVAKKPVAKKPATKKPAAKKPVAKKPVAKKPATTKTTTRPKRTANNLKIKKAANTAAKTTKQVIKKATPVVKKAASTVRKKAGEAKQAVDKKVSGVKKAFRKKAPKPTTPAQKAVSKVYQGSKNLIKKGLPKAKKAIGSNLRSSVKGGVAGLATTALASAVNTRMDRAFAKRKGMTLKEYQAGKKKVRDSQRIIPTAIRTVKGIAKRVRGKSGESSTQTNINKQKKANTKPNRGLKIRRTERSSKVNRNKDYNAPTATKTADKRFSTFRVDSNKNLKLQKERQKGNTETYSRKLSPQAKKQTTETKTNKKKTKKQSKFIKTASGSLARRGTVAARRAENREKARKRAQEMARRRLANR